MTEEELLAETALEVEPLTPRSLQSMKRLEQQQNGPYDYSVHAVLKVQNGSRTSVKWNNKIGGAWRKGSFRIDVLSIEIDAAMDQYGATDFIEIKGWVRSTATRATR